MYLDVITFGCKEDARMTEHGIRQFWFDPNRKVEMYMFVNNCGLVCIIGFDFLLKIF